MAPMARFVPDALRRLTPLLARTGVVFIAINQVRIDIGKMFGDPTSTPGGKAWKHGCSVMIHFTMSEKKDSNFFDENGRRYGHIGAARIDKNKVAFPGSKCSFDVEYGHGVVRLHKEIANLGVKFGIVKKPNAVVYTYTGDEKEYSWRSKDAFFDGVLEENLSDEILRKVKEARELGVEPVAKVEELEIEEDIEELMSENEEIE
jgi:recombination protein RecA